MRAAATEDLTVTKDFYRPDNVQQVANAFGYVLNREFIKALDVFYIKTVDPATVVMLLKVVADYHFKSWRPPLERIGGDSSPAR